MEDATFDSLSDHGQYRAFQRAYGKENQAMLGLILLTVAWSYAAHVYGHGTVFTWFVRFLCAGLVMSVMIYALRHAHSLSEGVCQYIQGVQEEKDARIRDAKAKEKARERRRRAKENEANAAERSIAEKEAEAKKAKADKVAAEKASKQAAQQRAVEAKEAQARKKAADESARKAEQKMAEAKKAKEDAAAAALKAQLQELKQRQAKEEAEKREAEEQKKAQEAKRKSIADAESQLEALRIRQQAEAERMAAEKKEAETSPSPRSNTSPDGSFRRSPNHVTSPEDAALLRRVEQARSTLARAEKAAARVLPQSNKSKQDAFQDFITRGSDGAGYVPPHLREGYSASKGNKVMPPSNFNRSSVGNKQKGRPMPRKSTGSPGSSEASPLPLPLPKEAKKEEKKESASPDGWKTVPSRKPNKQDRSFESTNVFAMLPGDDE